MGAPGPAYNDTSFDEEVNVDGVDFEVQGFVDSHGKACFERVYVMDRDHNYNYRAFGGNIAAYLCDDVMADIAAALGHDEWEVA